MDHSAKELEEIGAEAEKKNRAQVTQGVREEKALRIG